MTDKARGQVGSAPGVKLGALQDRLGELLLDGLQVAADQLGPSDVAGVHAAGCASSGGAGRSPTHPRPDEGAVGLAQVIALEPLDGIEIMQQNRGTKIVQKLTWGHGHLAEALRIEGRADGLDLCEPGPLWIGHSDREISRIGESVRIGLSAHQDTRERAAFYEQRNRFISGAEVANRPTFVR
ncbi:DNA-3-methyladenine glycosylase [Caulobacter sp. SL161]|uniref:DNA-3-methyladenine glycosylase n=1 Tax=Caulobacter sp. SL161 TaxID=2995156 RepID=UPI002276300D|nr:DNA-3-methyladenine glycosylase [Caulobacter sp. SL161]MCY1646649.1 DNA-3-methyladenine glycosylase [Caulobacter sp. SL161]